jgi:hypothetical protein
MVPAHGVGQDWTDKRGPVTPGSAGGLSGALTRTARLAASKPDVYSGSVRTHASGAQSRMDLSQQSEATPREVHLARGVAVYNRRNRMPYRNKTFVSFASEDIHCYRMMCAWRENESIEFDFHDAHDLNTALDTSQPDTIRRRLRERLANTKQIVLLVGDKTRSIAANSARFLYYEVEVIKRLELPVVFANVNGARSVERSRLPSELLELYTISVSFQPKIIKHALDDYVAVFAKERHERSGPYHYKARVYTDLGL